MMRAVFRSEEGARWKRNKLHSLRSVSRSGLRWRGARSSWPRWIGRAVVPTAGVTGTTSRSELAQCEHSRKRCIANAQRLADRSHLS